MHAKTHAEIQPKLGIGAPGDAHEQEADRVADALLRIPEPATGSRVQEAKRFRIRDEQAQNTPAVGGSLALSRGGEPLQASVRDFFEPRFGYDFSGVRVHTDIVRQLWHAMRARWRSQLATTSCLDRASSHPTLDQDDGCWLTS